MIILTDTQLYSKLKSRDLIDLQCENCSSKFSRPKNNVQWALKRTDTNYLKYCSSKCKSAHSKISVLSKCGGCNVQISVKPSVLKKSKSGKTFCSKSCAVTYNNINKTHGLRRSKLELWLQTQLSDMYPDLEIHYNKTDAIKAELDIFVPSLKLAFELNGVFHYEPIFGEEKLKSIKNNDTRKFQACLERNIELCIIDTSKQKYFKEKTSIVFKNIISDLINSKLEKSSEGEIRTHGGC